MNTRTLLTAAAVALVSTLLMSPARSDTRGLLHLAQNQQQQTPQQKAEEDAKKKREQEQRRHQGQPSGQQQQQKTQQQNQQQPQQKTQQQQNQQPQRTQQQQPQNQQQQRTQQQQPQNQQQQQKSQQQTQQPQNLQQQRTQQQQQQQNQPQQQQRTQQQQNQQQQQKTQQQTQQPQNLQQQRTQQQQLQNQQQQQRSQQQRNPQTPNQPAFVAQPGPRGPNRPQRIEDLRRERHEVKQDGRTIIQEAGRFIIREAGRTIIRHDEAERFRRQGANVQVRRDGNLIITVVTEPDGSRITTITDVNGRLIRRSRFYHGREIVLIDNRPRAGGPRFLDLPPPVIRGPRERYILDADRANAGDIYAVLMEPPVQQLPQRYSLDDIRYNQPLRAYMPSVDLDTVTFETGAWDLTPDQVDRLAPIADGIKRAIAENEKEMFMVEGHTDAVGSEDDNLSLSDRRAEAVAQALSQAFGVPPENLVTQGYGEQFLKVPTQGPERLNRRVTVRRITPLLDQQVDAAPPPPR